MDSRDHETMPGARDRAAFRDLLADELPRVRAFLFRLGAPSDDLDDLTQEVFLTVIRRLDRFRHESKSSTWILGIAVNVLRSWRRRRREAVQQVDVRPAAGSDPAGAAAVGELGEALRRALGRLSDPLREVFVLRYVEDLAAVEVARVLGLPEGTVRRRTHEARARLRSWLEADAPVDVRRPPREEAP